MVALTYGVMVFVVLWDIATAMTDRRLPEFLDSLAGIIFGLLSLGSAVLLAVISRRTAANTVWFIGLTLLALTLIGAAELCWFKPAHVLDIAITTGFALIGGLAASRVTGWVVNDLSKPKFKTEVPADYWAITSGLTIFCLLVSLQGYILDTHDVYRKSRQIRHIRQYSNGVLIGKWLSLGDIRKDGSGKLYEFTEFNSGNRIEIVSGEVQITSVP